MDFRKDRLDNEFGMGLEMEEAQYIDNHNRCQFAVGLFSRVAYLHNQPYDLMPPGAKHTHNPAFRKTISALIGRVHTACSMCES